MTHKTTLVGIITMVVMSLLGCSERTDGGSTQYETTGLNAEVSAETETYGDLIQSAWPTEKVDDILKLTQFLHLAPNLNPLSDAETKAVDNLLQIGEIFNDLYELSRHPQALAVKAELEHAIATASSNESKARAQKLLQLYYLNKGPIAGTLENNLEPFVSVDAERPGKTVYPLDIDKAELENYFATKPGSKAELLHLRSVVRRNNSANIQTDLATLDRFPSLDRLHPGFRQSLIERQNDPNIPFYAAPYSVAYAEKIIEAYQLLNDTAAIMQSEDPAFARFLRLRARDLLADDYDGGDAAWVSSQFTGNLNAQIGSYETYDDSLYGVKSFFSLSLLMRDQQRTQELLSAIDGIQTIENALPYANHKTVRQQLPVGVYSIIADFGQARGANTATILPNEGHLSRQHGRIILIRGNILTNPEIFARGQTAFNAAIIDSQHKDLQPDGNLYRTLWHEIGHYLGADRTERGEDLDAALQDTADLLEEMKADLVSLFAAPRLQQMGIQTEQQLRAIYASGILRVLQKNQPRRTQPYQTMQLIQWNWFLDKGLLTFDPQSKRLQIHYDQYPQAVESLLREVLNLQTTGDRDLAESFVQTWTNWDDGLHGVIANNMKASEQYRYAMVTYEALDNSLLLNQE